MQIETLETRTARISKSIGIKARPVVQYPAPNAIRAPQDNGRRQPRPSPAQMTGIKALAICSAVGVEVVTPDQINALKPLGVGHTDRWADLEAATPTLEHRQVWLAAAGKKKSAAGFELTTVDAQQALEGMVRDAKDGLKKINEQAAPIIAAIAGTVVEAFGLRLTELSKNPSDNRDEIAVIKSALADLPHQVTPVCLNHPYEQVLWGAVALAVNGHAKK
jgi:hypothetical protein